MADKEYIKQQTRSIRGTPSLFSFQASRKIPPSPPTYTTNQEEQNQSQASKASFNKSKKAKKRTKWFQLGLRRRPPPNWPSHVHYITCNIEGITLDRLSKEQVSLYEHISGLSNLTEIRRLDSDHPAFDPSSEYVLKQYVNSRVCASVSTDVP